MRTILKTITRLGTGLLLLSSVSALADGAGNTTYLTIFPNTPASHLVKVSYLEGAPTESGVPKAPLTAIKKVDDQYKKCATEGLESLTQALEDNGEAFRKYTTCAKGFSIEIKVIRYQSTKPLPEVPYGDPIEVDNKHISVPVYCAEYASNEETPALMYEDLLRVFGNSPKSSGSACSSEVQTPIAPPRVASASPVQKVVAATNQELAPLNRAPATPANAQEVVSPSSIFQALIKAKTEQQRQQSANGPAGAAATAANPNQ